LVGAVGLSLHSILLAAAINTSAWVITALGRWRLAYGVLGGWLLGQTLVWMVVARKVNAPVTAHQRAPTAPPQSPLKAPSGPLLGCLYYGLIPSALLGDMLEKKVHDRRLLLWGPALANTLFGVAIPFTSSP
jgi:hypothetical protein